MKRLLLIIISIFFCAELHGQGLSITRHDQQTSNYEDLSDFLRRFPGFYPLDYGVLGTPVLFRPWNIHPWEMRVVRDGIPMNRVGDGLYAPGLDPAAELESIDHSFLAGYPAGLIRLTSRTLPVDSPYTEFQIREGYYGYGVVDFAHGQRIRSSFTMEITGRLGWYDGQRYSEGLFSTGSKLNRLRGRFGLHLGPRWHLDFTYEGANIDADIDVLGRNNAAPKQYYIEREQGILRFSERDSLRSDWSPVLIVYVRQDREKWEGGYASREAVRGWSFQARMPVPNQNLWIRQSGYLARIDAPALKEHDEIFLELQATDTIDVGIGKLEGRGSVRRESAASPPAGQDWQPLIMSSVRFRSDPFHGFSVFGGCGYAETIVPIQWVRGEYLIQDRALPIDIAFQNPLRMYEGSKTTDYVRGVDRYLSTEAGIGSRIIESDVSISGFSLSPRGNFTNHFVSTDSTVQLRYDKEAEMLTQYGLAIHASIPIVHGFRVESDWFAQAEAGDLSRAVDTRGFSRLYFERKYFKSQLTVRSHLSYEYIGRREAYSDMGVFSLSPDHLFGLRISGTIAGVTLIWGVENLLNRYYEIMPGYRMIGKEEYFGVNWQLWL